MDGKGQLSADFLFATLLILIIAGSLISFVSSSADTANGTQISEAKVLADNLARSIDTVYSNGYGQYETFHSPTDFNYTVAVSSSGVSVNYKGKTVTSYIIPKDHIDSATINPGEKYNITNNNGQIHFENITGS